MTPLNLVFTVCISLVLAAGAWGLGKYRISETLLSINQNTVRKEAVEMVAEADIITPSNSKTTPYVTVEEVAGIFNKLMGGVESKMNFDSFREKPSLLVETLKKLEDPNELKEKLRNPEREFAVIPIDKAQLLGLLMPNPAVDQSFEVKVDNKAVEFVSLEVEKCWLSKEEMGEAPSQKKPILAGTGPSAIEWNVLLVSPTKEQWLAALEKGEPPFNDLKSGKGEHLADKNVIGQSNKAKGEAFEKAMTEDERKKTLLTMMPPELSSVGFQKPTNDEIKKKAQELATTKYGKKPGDTSYTSHYSEARIALEESAKKLSKSVADDKSTELTTENFAYRWVIPYPLP